MRGLYLVVGLIVSINVTLQAQTISSAQSGPWNQASTWTGGVIPTSSNSTLVSIGSAHVITIPAGYAATAVSVSMAGGVTNSLTISDPATNTGSLTFSGTLTLGSGPATRGRLFVNGALNVEQGATIAGGVATTGRLTVNSGGTYRHNYTTTAGTIYTATWNAGSTLEIAGYTSNTATPAGLGQAFSNFTWNCANQGSDFYLDGSLVNVAGNFTVLEPVSGAIFGLTTSANTTLAIGGNLSVASDVFFDLTGGAGNTTINLLGNLIMNSDDGIGNFGSGTATINFRGTSTQSFNSAFLISSAVDFVVFTNSRLDIPEPNSIQTLGSFTLQSGATLGVASVDGLVTGTSAGAIRTFGPRTYTSGGNIVYNGTQAQSLGDEWGDSGELDGVAVNLEINNSSVGGVTNNIIGSTSLVGRLRLTQGALNIGNSNTLIISGDFDGFSSPTRVGTISGDASNTSNLEFGGSGTVSGTLNFTTGASTLQNFTISRGDDIYLGSSLTIATTGVLSFPSSGNLRINGQTLTVNGNITQTGAGAIATQVNTSNLIIGGSGALTALPLCTSCPFTNEFNNVTLGRTGGASYSWSSSANINGILDLTSGTLTHSSGLNMATGSTFRRSAGTTYSGSTPNATTRFNVAYIGNVTTSNELSTTALDRLQNLTIAGNVSLDKNISINGDLNINSGTFQAGAHNITMLGATFAINGGSFNINSANTVTFSRTGPGTTLSGTTINDAQFGNFTISSGATVTAPSANINISNLWSNSGTFNPNNGTVTFNGTAQNIDAAGQPFFNVATSGGTKTLVAALDANGQITINSGSTLFADSYTINIAGVWDNNGTFNAGTGTVIFDGTSQSIDNAGQSFNNLTISTAASTKTLASALDVNNQLSITAGATLDVTASNFAINVGGNFINSGTFNPRAGTVFLDGSVIQNLSGSTNTVFNNITCSNPSNVTVASAQSIAGVLTLTAGTFNPNNNFTLLSSASRDARIAPLTGGAVIGGGVNNRITVQRYLPNNNASASFRYLTVPVTNAFVHVTGTERGWKDDFPITGTFNDPSTLVEWAPNFQSMNVNGASMYRYNEAKTPTTTIDDRYESYPLNGTASTAATLDNGRGYSVLVRWTTPVTIEVSGNAAFGTIPVTVTNQAGGGNDGWNLIGNPYPSPINWDNVTIPAGVGAQIAVKDNTNTIGLGAGQYIYYTQGGPGIPASYNGTLAQGQAFWVRKTTAGSTDINFQEDDKSAVATPPVMKDGPIDMLRINVAGNQRQDELIIRFDENAQDVAEGQYDAYKLENQFITFSSLSADGQELAINSFSALTCSREIPLVLRKVTAGAHAFRFTEFGSFPQDVDIRLLDAFAGETFHVTDGSDVYNFQVTSDANSFGANRFKLFIGYHDLDLGLGVEAGDICSNSDAQIRIQAPQTGVVYHATVNGTIISDEVVATGGSDLILSIPKANLPGNENTVILMAQIAGCGALPLEQSVSINVESIPVISNVTGESRCGEGTVTLKADGAPANGSYKWYLTEDAIDPIAGETGSSLIVSGLTKTKTYFVSAVNALGCEGGRMAVTATVGYAHEVAGVTGAKVCAGEGSTIHATGAPEEGQYRWYLSQNSVEPIPNQSQSSFVTAPLSATTTYYVAILNSTGCESARVPVTVEVVSLADAEITVEGNVLTSNSETGNQWHLNGVPIPGANGKTYTALESGVYKLIVSNGNCSTSAEREYSVTGDIDIAGAKGLMLYPNPSSGAIYIEVATTRPVAVSIKNQLGAEVAASELKQEGEMRKGQLDITAHAAGIYMVVIKSGENTVTRKIIKN